MPDYYPDNQQAPDESIDQIADNVGQQMDQMQPQQDEFGVDTSTGHFKQFRKEEEEEFMLHSFYEKFGVFAYRYMPFLKLSESQKKNFQDAIDISGLKIEPVHIVAGSLMAVIFAAGIALPLYLFGVEDLAYFLFFTGCFISYVSFTYPDFSAQITKIRAQQESLLAILYMTIYMRVNPILENALYFASQHLNGPLGKDLKNILWLIDTEKVNSIEDGINYLIPLWIKRNKTFVRSLLTLHSVINQPDKENQARILDKSLNTILTTTYEKMKRYAHNLAMPITILSTFGMMLPLIGLIAFPMMSIFMADSINIGYLFFGYIVVLPLLLWFFTRRIIAKRPGAFSVPDIRNNPYVPPDGKYRLRIKDRVFMLPVTKIALITGALIMLPGLYHVAFKTMPAFIEAKSGGSIPCAEYTTGAMYLSMLVPLGLAIGVAIYFYGRSIQKLRLRDKVVEIEDDLGDGLFQLGNQFTERIPIELAIDNFIAEFKLLNLKKKSIFHFFQDVIDKMQDEGKTFSQAVFDDRNGVLLKYPSVLLKEISWIVDEGSKKGSEVLYSIVNKISTYLENTQKIKELIYDLLTETVTQINMQAKFLAPFIAGIVGSLTLVIIKVLYELSENINRIMNSFAMSGTGISDSSQNFFSDFINFAQITPPTLFQVLVGIYMVQSVILLSLLSAGIQHGFDKISRDVQIGKNMIFATIVYVLVTVLSVIGLLSLVASGSASLGINAGMNVADICQVKT